MSGTPRICFWNYSDGDCVFMTQSLIRSMRAQDVEHDFLCFADRPVIGATRTITAKLTPEQKQLALFKIEFLTTLAEMSDYDYFVCIDSDSIFVKPLPEDFLAPMQFSPLHGYLETEFDLVADMSWYNIKCGRLAEIWRKHGALYGGCGMNSGIWIVERRVATLVHRMIAHFKTVEPECAHFQDEVLISWAVSTLSGNEAVHKLLNNRYHWLTHWQSTFTTPPTTETPWVFQDWFTGYQAPMQPAIVHLLNSKPMLIELGKKIVG